MASMPSITGILRSISTPSKRSGFSAKKGGGGGRGRDGELKEECY